MSEREHSESEVAEAAAAPYRTDAEALREVLERVAAVYPIQPCRVVEDASGDEPVLRLEYWGPAPYNSHDRWVARQEGRPHPPRPVVWRPLRDHPVNHDWTDAELAEFEAKMIENCAHVREDLDWDAERRKHSPAGYEADYDFDDWLLDLRRGTW